MSQPSLSGAPDTIEAGVVVGRARRGALARIEYRCEACGIEAVATATPRGPSGVLVVESAYCPNHETPREMTWRWAVPA